MTDPTITVDTSAVPKKNNPAAGGVDAELVARLVEQARAAGLQLTGEGGGPIEHREIRRTIVRPGA